MTRKPLPPDIMGDVLNNASGAAVNVPLVVIDDNPFQERTDYGDLTDLANDIREHGLLQPPMVRQTPDGRYQLAFGHRRKRACELADMTVMLVVVRAIDDERMATIAYSENEKRLDVSAIDRAKAIQKMQQQFGWTQQQIADKLSLARSTIANILRLLELPPDIQAQMVNKGLSARQGEALVSLMTLPQSMREAGERRWDDNTRPSAIVKAALNGASSDVIRKRTTELIRISAKEVHDEPWYDMVMSDEAGVIVSSTCKNCPVALKRDSGVFCTGPAECIKARADQWAIGELKLAAAELGIPAFGMEPSFGTFQDMNSYDTRDLFKELRTQGCPHSNLKLAYKNDRWGKGPFENFPNASPICAHGEGHKCRCLMAKQRQQTAEGTANKTTESVGKKLVAEAAAVLAEALTTVPDGILRHVWAPMVDYTLTTDDTKDLSRDEFALRMAVQVLRRKVDNYNSIQTNKDRLEKILQGAGLISPWTLAGQITGAPADNTFPEL